VNCERLGRRRGFTHWHPKVIIDLCRREQLKIESFAVRKYWASKSTIHLVVPFGEVDVVVDGFAAARPTRDQSLEVADLHVLMPQ
jgi:hypothetical protein